MHPFFVGHITSAIVLGALVGAMVGVFGRLEGAAYGVALMGGAALVSAGIAAIGRGYDAPAGRVWLVATMGNPVFLLSLAILGSQWECFARPGLGAHCLPAVLLAVLVVVCCLTPCTGLLLRWWSWRRT